MSEAIREPAPADAPRLHRLIRDHAAFERNAASLTLAELEGLLAAEPRPIRFLVAERADDLAGYAAVTFDWSIWHARRYAHLDCLFVDEAHRGQGIGQSLLSGAKAIAAAAGVDRMVWQTPDWNENARRFYIREGAESAAKWSFSVRLP